MFKPSCFDCISREAELKEARAEIRRLTERVDSLKNLLNREKHSRRKSAQRVILNLFLCKLVACWVDFKVQHFDLLYK